MLRLVPLIVICAVFAVPGMTISVEEETCLTWSINENILHLTCKITQLSATVSVVSPSEEIVGNCVYESTVPICYARYGTISQNLTTNETLLMVSESLIDIEGDWKCVHGYSITKTHVSAVRGIITGVQVHLKGELNVVNQIYQHKLMCFSCWKPIRESVEFFLNTRTVDTLRFRENNCYHRNGECNLDKCSCDSSKNTYTWIYKTTDIISSLNFSCGMRFRDSKAEFVKYAYLMFNGKDYIDTKSGTTNIIQEFLDKTSADETGNDNSSIDPSSKLWYAVIGITLSLMSMLIIVMGIMYYCRRNNTEGGNFASDTNEMTPLLRGKSDLSEPDEPPPTCGECREISTFAFCVTCLKFLCETCSNDHRMKSPDDIVVQIINILGNTKDPYCNKCGEKKLDLNICRGCKILLCETCASKCPHYKMKSYFKPINNQTDNSIDKSYYSEYEKSNIKFKMSHHLKINVPHGTKPTRIRGIAYLTDKKIVIADYNNLQLKMFELSFAVCTTPISKLCSTIPLEHEPRGMVSISDSEVAVTYCQKRIICIIDVNNEIITNKLKVPGKPFSIAYHRNIFAVELDEREDGFIAMLTLKGDIFFKTSKNDFAFFTGNTIRLALDANEQKIYVSALGKQEVICINYDSNKIEWKTKAPSPRALMVLPANEMSVVEKSIILLASRTGNTIYQLDSKKGRKKVILDLHDGVDSPRYMAYHQTKSKIVLAIEESGTVKVYEMWEGSH